MTEETKMDWCCIAVVNDMAVLEANLAVSPALVADSERLILLRNQSSASIAYNAGLDATTARICVFAHQDIYLPKGWEGRLAEQVAQLDRFHPDWAVAGLFGVDCDNVHVGRVWDGGLDKELGRSFERPVDIQSIDELIIILNRDKKIRFDCSLPSFHLYGTDIVQTALSAGYGAFVIHAPVIHNSVLVAGLHGGFMRAYDYMRNKWWSYLPITTPVTRITRSGIAARLKDLRRYQLNFRNRKRIDTARMAERPDPQRIARKLGYE
ncbi:hypothetical protein ACROSR_17095 [Roseovarius tibetensis]|uniref:hypothetical protein n=1 Tax=Roseovarius tibetensis TaxID=2685897 RepID=UPI003D7F9323